MLDLAQSPAIHHIALKVRDVERVALFYTDLLGLPLCNRLYDHEQRLRSIWIAIGSTLLMLERTEHDAAEPRSGWHLLALRIAPSDRNLVEQKLNEAGVAITGHTDFTLYIHDPEGNRIGLSHWPVPADKEPYPLAPEPSSPQQ